MNAGARDAQSMESQPYLLIFPTPRFRVRRIIYEAGTPVP
jgi:hypothetical protein